MRKLILFTTKTVPPRAGHASDLTLKRIPSINGYSMQISSVMENGYGLITTLDQDECNRLAQALDTVRTDTGNYLQGNSADLRVNVE